MADKDNKSPKKATASGGSKTSKKTVKTNKTTSVSHARTADKQKADNNGQEEKKKKTTTKRNAKGQFVKGTEKIENSGRKQGTPNKYGNVRDRLKAIILPYLNPDPDVDAKTNTLFKDLMKLDNPATRADLVSKFLPFIVPKYSSTTISADSERPMAEEERLLELDKEYKKNEKIRRQTEVSIKTLTIVDNEHEGKETSLPQSYIDECISTDEEDNDDDE